MPATDAEMVRVAVAFCREEIMPDAIVDVVWADGERITREETRAMMRLIIEGIRRAMTPDLRARRKALRLLRRFMTPEQRHHLQTRGYFFVTAASGNVYRLEPYYGMAFAVKLHKQRYYETVSYCLHDYPDMDGTRMPPGDVTLGHLLLLSSDEAAFLETANATPKRCGMWDGDWRRRLNAARRERAALQNELAANEEAA